MKWIRRLVCFFTEHVPAEFTGPAEERVFRLVEVYATDNKGRRRGVKLNICDRCNTVTWEAF